MKRRAGSSSEEQSAKRRSKDLVHRSELSSQDEAANVGILESVSVKNFMCHERLDFKFSPNVNFIIGRNGSGKSAIIAAVVIGLGGKAMVTSRGSSMKNFIKNGKQFCEISIKLRNRNEDAYKPDEYGPMIIVERRISANGSSTYKLKSHENKVISHKKDELIHILDQFNIQVDNPVSILNQDTSKTFLQSKNANDKYKFFLKATQLEQMSNDYVMAEANRKEARAVLDRKANYLPGLHDHVKDLERQYNFHQCLGDMRKKVEDLKHQLVWAHVIEKEKVLKKEEVDMNGEKDRLPKFEQKVAESKKKVEEMSAKIGANQAKLKEIAESVNEIQPKVTEFKVKLGHVKAVYDAKSSDMRKVTNEMHGFMKEHDHVTKRINELKNQAQHDNSEERRRRLEKIELLEKEKSEISAQLKTRELYLNQLKSSITQKKQNVYSFRQEEKDIRQAINQKHRILKNLEGSESNQLRRYGEHIPELLQRIDQAHSQGKFVKKPLGPIGAHVKLKDANWALAIETCLGSLMHAFCCHCHEDAAVLESILRTVIQRGRKPVVIISAFQNQMYNVSKYAVQPVPKLTSVLEVLDVENPVIINCLIDQRSIENILLIADMELAGTIMGNSAKVPRNCKEAFTIEGDHVYPAPGYRWYSCNKSKVAMLRGSVTDQINEIKDELTEMQSKIKDIERNLQQTSMECRRNETEFEKTQQQLMKDSKVVGQLNIEIADLMSIEDPEPVDITALEEEQEIMAQRISELKARKKAMESEYNDVTMSLNELKTNHKKYEEQMQSILSEEYEPHKDAIALIENQLTQARSHFQHYEKKMNEHVKKISELQKSYEKNKSVVNDYIAKAEAICPRKSSRRTAQNIESEIVQITKQVEKKAKSYASFEDVSKQYKEAKLKYDTITADVQKLTSWINLLESTMEERRTRLNAFKVLLSMRIRYMFISTLTQANYTGKMEFNHNLKELSIQVQPVKGVKDLQSDMKSLSGGERSFSTVSFILALWEAMESPFRMLDEFDVFMDMVNRRISMDLMLNAARQNRSRQFIFLTPLEMSKLKMTPYIKIFKMADPDRTQTALPFEAVNRTQEEEED